MPGKSFEKLCEPGQIGPVKTRNRMVKPGQSMHFATEDGYVSDTNLGFYEAIAKSGVGLIVVEQAFVDYPMGYASLRDLRADDDKFIPRLAELAALIHRYDTPTFLQINHAGPNQHVHADIVKAPSTMTLEQLPAAGFSPSEALTVPEIEAIVEKFAATAERARKAGFEGVEVHAAHAYLLASFMSDIWNKRQDSYGGSLENRARFACDVIRAIKARGGKDFPVGVRINGAEYGVKDGLTPGDTRAIAPMLQESGADYIHVSAYGFGPYNRIIQPEQVFYPEAPVPLGEGIDASRHGAGGLTLLSASVKKAVSIPVVTVGRLEPVLAEKVLREGRADFVALGRCLMADPEVAKKVIEGRPQEIRPCTTCMTCLDRYAGGKVVVCRVNASLGREWDYAIKPAEKKKRVMVVGAGPAGMEAARVAALRGHDVTLYEKEPHLGGAMLIVTMVKGPEVEDLLGLVRYYRVQLKKVGVKVITDRAVDRALVEKVVPDALILATGGVAASPQIPGIDKPVVMSQLRLHHMVKPFMRLFGPKLLRWLTNVYLPLGKRVVIIGGAVQGIELAEFLVRRGRRVTVTEPAPELGADMIVPTRLRLLPWLEKKGAVLLSGVKYEEITDRGVTIVTKEGEKRTIEADTVLTALPLKPDVGLLESLKGTVPEIHPIGDCREPHLIVDAVSDGFRTALKI